MPRYLDPKNDLMFKKVFGEHKNLCISLLNSLLKFEGDRRIGDIEYRTGELLPELPPFGKNSIVDVRCQDLMGRQFIVEMQMYWTNWFQTRVLFNASKAYVTQLEKGEKYEIAQPVYSLCFVNDIFDKNPASKDVFYHHYKIVNIKNTEEQIKGLEFVFVELPKYKPDDKKEMDYFDLWLRYLTEINAAAEEISPDLLEKAEIREAVECVLGSSLTPAEREAYDRIRDAIMTTRALFEGKYNDAREDGYKEGYEEGKERGYEKGSEKGWEKGREKGREEGREEGLKAGKDIGMEEGAQKKAIEVAVAMKAKGIAPDTIADVTKLPLDTILRL
jgi:predicted transposase/invertase (TIGR01784 family)